MLIELIKEDLIVNVWKVVIELDYILLLLISEPRTTKHEFLCCFCNVLARPHCKDSQFLVSDLLFLNKNFAVHQECEHQFILLP